MTGSGHPSDLRRWEIALLGGIWVGLAMLFWTPFVVTSETAFSYVVGKAVYSRALIEIVVALVIPLALTRPEYRPARSWVLVLLALSLATSLLAAAFGVSLQRSLWSTYERMQGVVDAAHWVALTLVLACVLRGCREWRALLALNLVPSVAMALLVIGRFSGVDGLYLADVEEVTWRMSASFGNSAFLGGYALVSFFVAGGLAAWSLWPSATTRRSGLARLAGAFFVCAALLNLCTIALSGSLGAYLGLVGGLGCLAFVCAILGRARSTRWIGRGVVVLVGVAVVGLAVVFFVDNPFPKSLSNPVINRLAYVGTESLTTRTRLAAWEAGYLGFLDRPVLGWGPDNYLVPFSLHGEDIAAETRFHDYAHNDLVEQAATKGIVGVAVYAALWFATFYVLVCRARRLSDADVDATNEQLLTLFVGAALMADLLMRQTLFSTTASSLQYAVLVGLVVWIETVRRAGRQDEPRKGDRGRLLSVALSTRAFRVTVGFVGLGVVTVGLFVNSQIYAAAKAVYQIQTPGDPVALVDRAIATFTPLANYPRRILFMNLTGHWQFLRTQHPGEARRMLARADEEAVHAVQSEPYNPRIHFFLANLYETVSATEPGYRAKADYYRDRYAALAPARAADRVGDRVESSANRTVTATPPQRSDGGD